jgi:hypothetical protein
MGKGSWSSQQDGQKRSCGMSVLASTPAKLTTWVRAKTASASDAVAVCMRRLFRCQWTRRLLPSSSASCSPTGHRNALPAHVARPSQLPASHITKDEEKQRGWVRARQQGKAGGHPEKMHFRTREPRSLRDTQWSHRTCCGAGGRGRGE